MTLDEYLTKNGITETAFAQEIDVSQSYVHRLRTNQTWPSKEVAVRIRAKTDGHVTADDFLPPPD